MNQLDALIQPDRGQKAIALHLVDKQGLPAWLAGLTLAQRAVLAGQGFEGGAGETAIVPDAPIAGGGAGEGWFAVAGVADPAQLASWCLAPLAERLPAGTYRLAGPLANPGAEGPALIGWRLAQYR
ncbi:MAG: leucyl aminopeptidase family protein, partial [Novosphingobium sp.]|nr:leucyl aminopeptidase family protein [Novosphingobium sp.]